MERIKSLFLPLVLLTAAQGLDLKAQTVDMLADGKLFRIGRQTTQCERKAGWNIAGIQTKSTLQRYLWGARSKQLTDSRLPQFVVDTDTLLLSDMVMIKLTRKREYRKVPAAEVKENPCVYVDLNNFDIQPYGEEGFLIRPLKDLAPGEYIFTWTTGAKIGELEDWSVWPFSVE